MSGSRVSLCGSVRILRKSGSTREGARLHVNPGPPDPDATTARLHPLRTSGRTFELFGYYVVHADDELVLNEIADAMAAELTRHAAAGLAHIRKKNASVDHIRTTTATEGAA